MKLSSIGAGGAGGATADPSDAEIEPITGKPYRIKAADAAPGAA